MNAAKETMVTARLGRDTTECADATILVTGGAGFIGSHTIERLLAETSAQIVCLDNFCRTYSPRLKQQNVDGFRRSPRVELAAGSFCDRDYLAGVFAHRIAAERPITHVVHLGAHAGVRLSERFPQRFHAVNVVGSERLLAVAAEWHVRRVVLLSSSAVYGRGAALPFREQAPLGQALSPYAETKRSMEAVGLDYWRRRRLPVVILRPFSVYGPRLRPDLSMHIFGRRILRGEPITIFGSGDAQRDWTHVDDLTRAIVDGIVAPRVAGEVLNVGAGQAWRIDQMVRLLAKALGRDARIEHTTPHAADMPTTTADLSRAAELLDYRPQVTLPEGIQSVARWLMAAETVP